MVVDIGNPKTCYECLIRNQGYSGDGMKCGKTGSIISWYDGNRQRMSDCPLEAYWIIGVGVNPTCSCCKFEAPAILFDGKWSHEFCPNCGIHMKGEIQLMTKLEKAKEIITKNFSEGDCGIFDSRNIVGDRMTTIYNDDDLTIDICYPYSYFEVFGLSDEEFDELARYYSKIGDN